MKRTLLYLVVALLFCGQSVYSQDYSVALPDTLIPYGKTYLVPVEGEIASQTSGKITLEFNFDGTVIDIKRAIGGSTLGFHSSNIEVVIVGTSWKNQSIQINESDYKSSFKGTLCFLEIEGLAGPDSTTILLPTKFLLDGIELSSGFDGGQISTKSPLINKMYPEGLSRCYPNPFSDVAFFDFNIEEDSKVKFKVFSSLGRLVETIPMNDKNIQYEIFNEKNELLENTDKLIFPKGSYKLRIKPVQWEFASGAHFVVMETRSGVYYSNFVFIK